MRSILSLILIPAAVVLADQPQGIDYLGAGYDLVFGNPDGSEASSSVTDPGFRVHLIKFNWDDDDNTCSGLSNNWTCPREVSIMPDTSCLQQSSSTAITSTKEFQEVLQEDCSVSASVSAGFGGFSAEASFSASKSMASMQNKISTEDITTFQSKAVCVEYTATLKLGYEKSLLEALPEFSSAVGGLPVEYNSCFLQDSVGGPCPQRVANGFGDIPPVRNDSRRLQVTSTDKSAAGCACDVSVAKYFKFIQLFGTHYTTRVEMGGKIVHRLEIKNSDVETLKNNKVDVEYGASIKASYLTASVSVEGKTATSTDINARNSVKSVATKEININVGGSPSEDWRDWAKTTTDTPMPIRYRLSSLVDLIQNVDASKVAPFEGAVKDYIAAYGKTLSFDTAPDAKVQLLEVRYSLDAPTFGWIKLRATIGKEGAMMPAEFKVYTATGSIRLEVPEICRVSWGAFNDNIPVTLTFLEGRFYPPVPSVNMEAKRTQRHVEAKHWINMEAKLAMSTRAFVGFTSPASVTFVTTQVFAVMSDNSVLPLGNQYAGMKLDMDEPWSISPVVAKLGSP